MKLCHALTAGKWEGRWSFSSDSTNIEEEEVRKMLRECLDLRKSYVYTKVAPWREVYTEVAPWMEKVVPESYSSKTQTDPFHIEPLEASTASCVLLIVLKNKLSHFKHDKVAPGSFLMVAIFQY